MRIGRAALSSLAATALLGCAAGRNPPLVVPSPALAPGPVPVTGQVVRADTVLPLPGARVRLWQAGRLLGAQTAGPDGAFRFDSVPRGPVVVETRMIGFMARTDSLVLAYSPPLRLTIPLRPTSMCLGHCPPDPAVVAAARAQRDHWLCDRERASIEQARATWLRFLRFPAVRHDLGLEPDSSQDAARLQFVRADAECRRVAEVLDTDGWGVTSLAFTVFRYAGLRFISEPYSGEGAVYDQQMRHVGGIVLE